MPRDVASKHVVLQLVRSATSVGANYEEARAGESPADFIHKLGIATKEMRESLYWLQLITAARLSTEPTDALIDEAEELCAILGASIRTARRRS